MRRETVKSYSKAKIKILPVNLLDEERPHVEELKHLAKSLRIGLGWHYLLDLAWILRKARAFPKLANLDGIKVVDAGAGEGLLQWYLLEKGAKVISIDQLSRSLLCLRYRARYNVKGLRKDDLHSPVRVLMRNVRMANTHNKKLRSVVRGFAGIAAIAMKKKKRGISWIYNQNLCSLPHIPSNSQDTVMAVSALEHNHPDKLGRVVDELFRILKSGGVLFATLCASPGKNWYHKPSQGWCYSENDLRKAFRLGDDVSSNYHQYDEIMEQMKDCAELRDDLADFYYKSGNNGMPYGRWDPKYLPVGVYKVKKETRI
jgi:SAM-dependent methyltransferase